MSKDERPLSPHLTIYRWPITMTLSILHRITGVALAVGLVAFVFWLGAIAFQAVSYGLFEQIMRSVIGQIALLGWLFSFFFQADLSAWAVIVAAVLLTGCYWVLL